MTKLKIIAALIRYLYCERHNDGAKYTINRASDGRKWFMVEPAVIWISQTDADRTLVKSVAGQNYVKIGGGSQGGRYIHLGSDPELLRRVFAEVEDQEPNVG